MQKPLGRAKQGRYLQGRDGGGGGNQVSEPKQDEEGTFVGCHRVLEHK